MSESATLTDQEYEDDLQKAEHAFGLAHCDWRAAVGELTPSPIVLDEPERLHLDAQLLLKRALADLAAACREYLESGLRAFSRLVQRINVPRSVAIRRLDDYKAQILGETWEKKWDYEVKPLAKSYGCEDVAVEMWNCVELRARGFVIEILEPEIWSAKVSRTLGTSHEGKLQAIAGTCEGGSVPPRTPTADRYMPDEASSLNVPTWATDLDTPEGRKCAREGWKRNWTTPERECTNDDLTERAYSQKDAPFLNQWENGKARLKEPGRSSRIQAIETILRNNVPPKWHPSARKS
jgi:hypothetical protein